jgi:hypothetical protein
MSLTVYEIQKMLDVVAATRSVEIDCDGCLNQVGEFAESHLVGKPVAEGLKAVEQHLSICSDVNRNSKLCVRPSRGWISGGDVGEEAFGRNDWYAQGAEPGSLRRPPNRRASGCLASADLD